MEEMEIADAFKLFGLGFFTGLAGFAAAWAISVAWQRRSEWSWLVGNLDDEDYGEF